MKTLYIIKAGTTFPAIVKQFGDFDTWTLNALGGVNIKTAVVDAEHGAPLPPEKECAGAVITGSHAMVTDNLEWSIKLEAWIRSFLAAGTPLLGICYGHQLLARAAGGVIGFHPRGREIGSVSVKLLKPCADDPIFRLLPQAFHVHTTHSQTVLSLPPKAVCLGASDFEPHHAFRIGEHAWGVQFHPEYTADIMRLYIQQQADELKAEQIEVSNLLLTVKPTPEASEILRIFGNIVKKRLTMK